MKYDRFLETQSGGESGWAAFGRITAGATVLVRSKTCQVLARRERRGERNFLAVLAAKTFVFLLVSDFSKGRKFFRKISIH